MQRRHDTRVKSFDATDTFLPFTPCKLAAESASFWKIRCCMCRDCLQDNIVELVCGVGLCTQAFHLTSTGTVWAAGFNAHLWARFWSERVVRLSEPSIACRYTIALLLLLQQHIITRTHNPKTMQDHIQINSWNKCKDTCACTFHIVHTLGLNNTTSGKVVKHQAASCWAETMQTIGIQYRKLTPSLLRT